MSQREEALSYLKKVFNLDLESQVWPMNQQLPLFIKNQYQFSLINSENGKFLLISEQVKHTYLDYQNLCHYLMNSAEINHYLFVLEGLTPYNIKRCIENKISFMIIGKQIYAPFLGLLFHPNGDGSYHPRIHQNGDKISPSSMGVLLEIISRKDEKVTQRVLINQLGLSPMTISRAINELKNLKVIELESNYKAEIHVNKQRLTQTEFQTHLPHPVERKIVVNEKSLPHALKTELILSGESALSEKTDLSAPNVKVYAVSKKALQSYEKNLEIGLKMEKNMIELEVWKYKVPTSGGMIDPWALYFSLIDLDDERIKSALESLVMNA
jgi:DNA-binding transcriptional regulator YhcF (GntR family)